MVTALNRSSYIVSHILSDNSCKTLDGENRATGYKSLRLDTAIPTATLILQTSFKPPPNQG
jgi:hypothetical protein